MNAQPTVRAIADALIREYYFRVDQDSGTVAWWPACNLYPQLMPNKPADRRAMLRTATRLRRPAYSVELWQEIVALLPDVTEVQP
jgi:hypothetical protein